MEYVLIEQDFVDVEVCRHSSGWLSNHYFLGDEIEMAEFLAAQQVSDAESEWGRLLSFVLLVFNSTP